MKVLSAQSWIPWMVIAVTVSVFSGQAVGQEDFNRLRTRVGTSAKKWEKLAEQLSNSLEAALSEPHDAELLLHHPYVDLVLSLYKRGLEVFGGRKSITPDKAEKFQRYKWDDLELVAGLRDGADRPIPDNVSGFIELGPTPEMDVASLGDLVTNRYLFGWCEVVSPQFLVKADRRKKSLRFEKRKKSTKVQADEAPPSWEAVRMMLEGTMPEMALSLPMLEHEIHSRLVRLRERDSSEDPKKDGETIGTRIDDRLAFLDSRLNGFVFESPVNGESIPLVIPAHSILVFGRKGALYSFENSSRLDSAGDLPFLSYSAVRLYWKLFFDSELSLVVYQQRVITDESKAFDAEGTWLLRYKQLVEMIARTILLPHRPFPSWLSIYDYQTDEAFAVSEPRPKGMEFNYPRKYALLLWAHLHGDLDKLAEEIHRILSQPDIAFPSSRSLIVRFSQAIQEREREMVGSLADRARGDSEIDDWFSPFQPPADTKSQPSSNNVLSNYHGRCLSVSRRVASLAREAVDAEERHR